VHGRLSLTRSLRLPLLTAPPLALALAVSLLLALGCGGGRLWPAPPRPALEPGLVRVLAVAPSIRCELAYATAANFTHRVLYDADVCLLRPRVAERLARVQTRLAAQGLSLVLLDAYRPLSVQRLMWSLIPDERYVADPRKGSRHNRGSAVDVTLLEAPTGRRPVMPTQFDEFSTAAARGAPCGTPEPCRNRDLLQAAMEAEGFVGLPTEWWHFDDPDWQSYGLLDVPLGSVAVGSAE
jgi:zinc D-Ala-D-Ala dipeptidase